MTEPRNGGSDWTSEFKEELSAMAKDGINHPSTKPVLKGAAVGAAAAFLLPVLSWPVGLVAGASFVLYQRVKK